MKFEVKHRVTGVVLASVDDDSKSLLSSSLISTLRKGGGKLDGADFKSVDLSYVALADTSFVGADFGKASLYCVSFSDCDFIGANFKDTNLAGAGFKNCKFTSANFKDADLRLSGFSDCDFTGADFSGATLDDIELVRCTTTGADFKDSMWRKIRQDRAPVSLRNWRDRYLVTILSHHIKIGCQCHTIEEWENFTDEEILHMDGRLALRWWHGNKENILELAL